MLWTTPTEWSEATGDSWPSGACTVPGDFGKSPGEAPLEAPAGSSPMAPCHHRSEPPFGDQDVAGQRSSSPPATTCPCRAATTGLAAVERT